MVIVDTKKYIAIFKEVRTPAKYFFEDHNSFSTPTLLQSCPKIRNEHPRCIAEIILTSYNVI